VNTWDENYRSVYEEGKNRVHPFVVPKLMNNAAASHVSMEWNLKGPSFSVATACASSNHAMGLAFQLIRGGAADVMVTGGSEAMLSFGGDQGVGRPARDVQGRLPPVFGQPQRHGSG
jgi:nodulation protein E